MVLASRLKNKLLAKLTTRVPFLAKRFVASYSAVETEGIPWTPPGKPLDRSTVALVTTAGVHHRDDPPFDMTDPNGDPTYRIIDAARPVKILTITHDYYDHADADKDINIVFPLERLQEFEREGLIGRAAERHYGFMGHIVGRRIDELIGRTAPEAARRLSGEGGGRGPPDPRLRHLQSVRGADPTGDRTGRHPHGGDIHRQRIHREGQTTPNGLPEMAFRPSRGGAVQPGPTAHRARRSLQGAVLHYRARRNRRSTISVEKRKLRPDRLARGEKHRGANRVNRPPRRPAITLHTPDRASLGSSGEVRVIPLRPPDPEPAWCGTLLSCSGIPTSGPCNRSSSGGRGGWRTNPPRHSVSCRIRGRFHCPISCSSLLQIGDASFASAACRKARAGQWHFGPPEPNSSSLAQLKRSIQRPMAPLVLNILAALRSKAFRQPSEQKKNFFPSCS